MQGNKKTRQSLRRRAAASRGVDDVPMQLDNRDASFSSNIPPPTSTNFSSSIDTSTQSSTVQILDNNHQQNRATHAASSSLQSNAETPSNNANTATTTSATSTSTTNSDFAKFCQMTSGGRSAEGIQKRKGYAPNGATIQTCGCNWPNGLCRQIMWEWVDLGEDYEHMVDYVYVPKYSQKTTPLGIHTNGYRKICIHHLSGQKQVQSEEIKEKLSKNNQIPIAIHHFPQCLRGDIEKSKELLSNIDKFRSSKDNGKLAGLEDSDLCKVNGTDGIETYYTVPKVVDSEDVYFELDQAKKRVQLRSAAKSGTTKQQSQSSKKLSGSFGALDAASFSRGKKKAPRKAPRKSPVEREFEQSSRKIAANPEQHLVEKEELMKRLAAAEKALEEMAKEKEQDKIKYEKKIKEMSEQFEELSTATGMTRITLLSDKWHEKNHFMANHLVGFEQWKHFREFVKHAFVLHNVDVNVKGVGKISDFEKICMVAMLARRAFRRPVFAGIYGKSPSAISRYLAEWVPKCGFIGRCLSELPLQKTHNFYDEDTAKEFKAPYIYPDGTVKDYGE